MPGRAAASVAAVLVLTAACTSAGSRPAPPPSSSVTPVVEPATSSTPPPESLACPAAARTIAGRAAGHGATVRGSSSRSRGLTTCRYRMSVASGHAACTSAGLRVDTGPGAFTDFNRWVDEQVQNSSVGRPGSAPVQVHAPRLGPTVEWVPALRTLQYGVLGRWVTVSMSCRQAARALTAARRLALTVPD